MLGEIARWHKRDIAEQAVYQVKVQETRRRLAELAAKKAAEAHAVGAISAAGHVADARPMPALEPHPEALAGVPAGEIITVVSGLPRSGTSLMMQILEAAGIPPFTDGRRQADESNRKGYYEHDKVASLLSTPDRSWLREAKGTAIKVVAPLLAGLPPQGPEIRIPNAEPLHYRVLFMERDMEEILQSQETMLERLGKSPAAGEKTRRYRQSLPAAGAPRQEHGAPAMGIHAMSVSYKALVHRPDEVLPQVAAVPRRGRQARRHARLHRSRPPPRPCVRRDLSCIPRPGPYPKVLHSPHVGRVLPARCGAINDPPLIKSA